MHAFAMATPYQVAIFHQLNRSRVPPQDQQADRPDSTDLQWCQ